MMKMMLGFVTGASAPALKTGIATAAIIAATNAETRKRATALSSNSIRRSRAAFDHMQRKSRPASARRLAFPQDLSPDLLEQSP